MTTFDEPSRSDSQGQESLAPPPSREEILNRSAALVGIYLAIVALAGGLLVAGVPTALAVGLWALAVGIVTWRGYLPARKLIAPTAGLTAVRCTEGLPVFVMQSDIGLVPWNKAARSMSAATGNLTAVLEEALGGSEGAVYRLGHGARERGAATARARLYGSDVTLQVDEMADGRQLWRFLPDDDIPEPEGGPPPAGRIAEGADRLLDDLPVALVRLAADGTILFANTAATGLLRSAAAEGNNLGDVLEGLGKPMPDRIRETVAGRAQGRSEVARGRTPEVDGFLQVTLSRVVGGDPVGPQIIGVLSDATELKTLEAQFVQSQKMQAVGQLAGGIAHDFNNLLTAINGHCDLLLLRHLQGDNDHADLIQIRQNANRAAALVRQLLAFSRKQTLRPQVLNLYDTLAELANLLNRLLGEKVELTIKNTVDIKPVRVDERQLEQVIVNLVVNARDAMPNGGVVSLQTRNVTLDAPLERDRVIVPPGDYSLIEVDDNGAGIPPDKVTKVFEPFFTTKKVGEGTGLGLSTAYGIIKQMDGYIFVDSTVNVGTRFQIYLPALSEDEARSAVVPATPSGPPKFRDPTGTGVILLVEDEAPVRAFATRALQMRGYTVLEADCGEAAIELLSDPDLVVDMFVSDVVMPGLDGPSWVREAYKTRPDASTVFISGYSEVMVQEGAEAVPRSSYLAKPFTLNDLIERVRDHMDRYVP